MSNDERAHLLSATFWVENRSKKVRRVASSQPSTLEIGGKTGR